MDAYDIFRKLTRGAQFSRKRKAVGNDNKKNVEEDIKQEPEDGAEPDFKEEDIFNHSGGEEEDEEDSKFEILSGSIEVKEKGKKKRAINPEEALKRQEVEELNLFRKANKININGKNVPPPIRAFDDLEKNYKVPNRLLENLMSCGYPHPTPIQMQALPVMLQGKSLMACAPTGSGKTVAFLVPVIRDLRGPQKKGFRAIILCPTRELAKQTYRECLRLTEKTGLKAHVISKIKQVEHKFGPNSSKKYDILISTPNRIRFLINQEPPVLDLSNIEWVVIDEADKLMEEGQNSFKEQLDEILHACTNSSKKIALFSATYTVPVAKWALRNLKGLIRVTVGVQNSATDLVNQELLFVGSESGKLLAFRDLVRKGLQPPVLVFVQSKERAKQLFDELIYDGFNVDVIHADRTQQQRDNVVKAFREGKVWVLICTELMGRGIDFKGVNLVVNYDFPPTAISYIHRIGRTGRAGRPGKAITYFTQDDTVNLRSIAQIIKNSGGTVPDFMLALKKTKKSEIKKLAKRAPERDDISTVPKFIRERREALKNPGKYVKIKKDINKSEGVNGKLAKLVEKKRDVKTNKFRKKNKILKEENKS